MKLWQVFEMDLEAARQSIPGGPQGWRPERMIFRDWWHWKDQEFGFAHGRLALTGQNAGGKSSVLALMIPMLLDGRTDPIRLDPAQSRDRFLHYYLLGADDAEPGNAEAFRYEARTGYVALEFYHVGDGRHLTIGMGVTASRSSARRVTDWWGFLLLKNQRLGRDFDVRGVDEACLGRRDFTRMLGDGGLVLTERAEYQRQVNQQIFGFADDDYQALIEMLLQARRPKLGEQTGPDKVCEMLSRALPGIPSDRLARVGEVINNIEEYRRNLADVQAKAEAVGRLDHALQGVAEALVQESAHQYQEAQSKYGSVASRLRSARENLEQAEQGLALLQRLAGERAVERAQCQAEQQQLSQGEGVDLQDRLEHAQAQDRHAAERMADLAERVADARQEMAGDVATKERKMSEFDSRRRVVVTRMQDLIRTSQGLTWPAGVQELQESLRATEVLTIADPAEVVLAAPPRIGLSDEARNLRREFQGAVAACEVLARAERERDQVEADINTLRTAVKQSADEAEAAKDRAEQRAEEIVAALQKWQEESPVLEPSDVAVARVAAVIRDRLEPPAGSHREFSESLILLGERRRHELQQAQADREQELRAARLQQDRLQERLTALEADPGDPARSEVRAAARAALGRRALPLFRQARFRPDVAAETAVLVETAILEAGWLDLLTEAAPGADAILVPQPITGPSLLEILEPEPGASHLVEAVLSSIGWGEGSGDRWVARDGRWQNGLASGQVAPWVPLEAGFLGSEARDRRRRRRLLAATAELAAATATAAALESQQRRLLAQMTDLDRELNRLGDLPWQGWFTALSEAQLLEQARDRARAKLEAAKPRLTQAEQAVMQAGKVFDAAVAGLPGAVGLSLEQLRDRSDQYLNVASLLEQLQTLCRELGETARNYHEQLLRLQRSETALSALQRDLDGARTELARWQATVRTLEGQIADPDLRARLAQLDRVRRRLRELDQEEEQARDQGQSHTVQRDIARGQMTELEPEERHWSEVRSGRLEKLKERLRLHVALEPHLEALEKTGPVSHLPKLLKLLESDDIASLVEQRRDELRRAEFEERNLLADYRPTPAGRDSLIFHDERLPLAAYQLRLRLALRAKEYAGLIEEEQRKLFQDIIYEGILDELRRLIRQAREFTRRTTEKLKRPLSDGEVLSLRWSPVSADQVPAAKIGAALEHMEQGSRFLSEEKRDVLLSTIKEEVERVRAVAQAQGRELSYHEAVAEALDYRRWYEFQILSRMPGAAGPVPIRTKGFGRRSNSAKAWALTVPILAAVAARYDAATRADVPRLIGLDEAFAGLDTNNQETYLGFLTDLGFSWVITIPDEVPYSHTLSAVMTYRLALEGHFHTGFPILWNGAIAYEPMAEWAREVAAGREP